MNSGFAENELVCPVCKRVYSDSASGICRDDGALLERKVPQTQLLQGKYKLTGELGSGGWGAVHSAEHVQLGKRFAVKFLKVEGIDPVKRERFAREAKSLSILNHPGIVSVVDYGVDPYPYIIMELVEGETLQDRLARAGRLSSAVAADYFLQMCEILEVCESKGIVHRDIKPSNIMIVELAGRQALKLLDFGLATVDSITATLTGQSALGSPAYMSPEQCMGAEVNSASDIYSLGCVIYECIAGRRAVESENTQACFYQHLNVKPIWAPPKDATNLDRALMVIVMDCLDKDPSARPRLETLRERLQSLISSGPPLRPPRKPKLLHINLFACLAAFLIFLSIQSGRLWFRLGAPPEASSVLEDQITESPVLIQQGDKRFSARSFRPISKQSKSVLLCITPSEKVEFGVRLCRRWAGQGFVCIMADSEFSLEQVKSLLAELVQSGSVKIDRAMTGLILIEPELTFAVDTINSNLFGAAILLDPVADQDAARSVKNFHNSSCSVFFLVDGNLKHRQTRETVVRLCEKAFVQSRGSQIYLNSLHANLTADNSESPETTAVLKLIDKFWLAFVDSKSSEKSFLLSSRALHALEEGTVYQWRTGEQ